MGLFVLIRFPFFYSSNGSDVFVFFAVQFSGLTPAPSLRVTVQEQDWSVLLSIDFLTFSGHKEALV